MNKIIAKKYHLKLDVKERIALVDKDFYCKENDSILLCISVMEDGTLKNIENCKFSLLSNRNDGTKVEQLIETPIIENGILMLSPKSEFTSVKCSFVNELTIFDEDESITIQAFNFNVISTIQNGSTEGAENSIDTLIELNKIMQKYKDDVNYIKDSITEINSILNGDIHAHANKLILDLITETTLNDWNNTYSLVGNGTINNTNITVIEALNDLYSRINSIIYYGK